MKTLSNTSSFTKKIIEWTTQAFLLFMVIAVTLSCKPDEELDIKEDSNPDPILYLDKYFNLNEVRETANIQYGPSSTFHYLDLIEVEANDDIQRPLILLSPGGGFKYYNRVPDLKDMARDLAIRGYVVAIVYYHVDKDLDYTNTYDVQKKWLEGIIDQKTAIRFMKKYAESYRIDADKIFIGGWSNGGQLAINTAALQESDLATIANEELRNSVTTMVDQEGGMEGDAHLEVNSTVRGALMLNAYTFDLNFIDPNDPAMMFIHHSESRVSGSPNIKTIATFQVGSDEYYGPMPITARAQEEGFILGEDLDFVAMEGMNYISTIKNLNHHEPNFAALSSFNYDKIGSFFYRNLE